MKEKKFYLSHLILSLFLICFGAGVGYYILWALFSYVEIGSFIALLFYIPTLLLGSVLPLYGGISMLVTMIKGKDESLYPPPEDPTADLLKRFEKRENNQE